MEVLRNKIEDIFMSVFEVANEDVDQISYQSVPTWDSIGHMIMVSELEAAFEISIDMDDVIVISNLETCIEKLQKYVQST